MSNALDLSAAFGAYLSARAGRRIEITGLTRLSSGWESDVYSFDAPAWNAEHADRGYVLRLYFGADAGQKAQHEYQTMQLLARAGYPVPRVDLYESAVAPLGRAFLIMQRVRGQALGRRWHDPDTAVRAHAIALFCDLFAQLHTLAWQHLPGADAVPALDSMGQFAMWEGLVTPLGLTSFGTGVNWLRQAMTQVTPQPPGLVHWDFHHENILIDDTDRPWVIDWTQFQATDVRFDLAWTLVVLASERDVETAQQVRAGYLAARGWNEAGIADDLRVFEAAACLKRVASVVVSLQRGADALGMRPGSEEIMTSRLARIATVYQRWLEITQVHLAEADAVFDAYL